MFTAKMCEIASVCSTRHKNSYTIHHQLAYNTICLRGHVVYMYQSLVCQKTPQVKFIFSASISMICRLLQISPHFPASKSTSPLQWSASTTSHDTHRKVKSVFLDVSANLLPSSYISTQSHRHNNKNRHLSLRERATFCFLVVCSHQAFQFDSY